MTAKDGVAAIVGGVEATGVVMTAAEVAIAVATTGTVEMIAAGAVVEIDVVVAAAQVVTATGATTGVN